jgi:hypothetical protein
VTPLDVVKTWEQKAYAHPRQFLSTRFSPCGKFLFAGGEDRLLHRFELDGDKHTEIAGHAAWVKAIAFHPDGKRLFTSDSWGTIYCWNYADAEPKPLWKIDHAHRNLIRSLAVTKDGSQFLSAGGDGRVRLWSAADGKPIRDLVGHELDVHSLAVHPDGSVVSGDLLGVVIQWDLATGKEARRLDAKPLRGKARESIVDVGGVRDMAFSPDGKLLACSGFIECNGQGFVTGKAAILELDWATGKTTRTMKPASFEGFNHAAVYLADGTCVGVGGGMGGGALWFYKPGEATPFHSLPGGEHACDIALHPDGLRLAAPYSPQTNANGENKKDKNEYKPTPAKLRVFLMADKAASAEKDAPGDPVKK